MFIGLVLLALGILWLLSNLGVLPGSVWYYAWPVILIIAGLVFIFGRHRRGFWTSSRWPRYHEHERHEEDTKKQP